MNPDYNPDNETMAFGCATLIFALVGVVILIVIFLSFLKGLGVTF